MLSSLKDWTLKDPIVSTRGAKSCPLECKGLSVYTMVGSLTSPVTTPFGATSYNDESSGRKTIEFSISDEAHEEWTAVAAWARGYICENAERLFKKKLSTESIFENFREPAHQKGDYRPLLRCKVNVSGSRTVHCWDTDGQRIPLPDDLRGIPMSARVRVDRLWCMSKEYGLVLEVTDIQLYDVAADTSCPFVPC
jgi:hypothetical protein